MLGPKATTTLIRGDARRPPLRSQSVQCAITSPPYWGLRKYRGAEDQIGLELTPREYVDAMRAVASETHRVLRDDGVFFCNLGDSYAGSGRGPTGGNGIGNQAKRQGFHTPKAIVPPGLKRKDLIGIPYMVAFALQADGWYWRDLIVWSKGEVSEGGELSGGAMPGSQRDRCTSSHEPILVFTKKDNYFWDLYGVTTSAGYPLRNVWRINAEPNKCKHFATMPKEVARRCVLLGTSPKGACPECGAPWRRIVERERMATRPGSNTKTEGTERAEHGNRDRRRHCTIVRTVGWKPTCRCGHPADENKPCVVFDMFNGSGTTGEVARLNDRSYIGIDLSWDYLSDIAVDRVRQGERPHLLDAIDSVPSRKPLPGQTSFLDSVGVL
jgi:site-specific DNA-methyltransferase (cytosine-N4-specific)